MAVTEQRRHRNVEVLTEQVEQRRFDRGDRVHGDPKIEGLRSPAAGIASGEGRPDGTQRGVVAADRRSDHQLTRVLQGTTDGFAAGYLAHTDAAVGIGEHHQVPGEVRGVGAAEIEQHAVASGNRINGHLGDDGSGVA